ncbi:MAG: metal-dependent hydrolase [Novosphingobium lindaniclasticum]|jgi:inner membrane protein|nr:metal-dependent hydrolase [Novosphingobium lindaniclasticum]
MRRTRKGLAACVLAANMPDIDVFFGWAPWEPLAMHRGFTHGLVGGVLLMPPILAGLLWLLDRWQLLRQGAIRQNALPMHFGWLTALCYLGALTHPLLDLQNVYAVQLLSPLSRYWYHTDGLFIVDPWIWIMLGLGIWRSRRRRSGGPVIAALLAAIVYIGANIGIARLAYYAVRNEVPYAAPDRIFAGPKPLAFWRREVIWRQSGRIARGEYDLLQRPFGLVAYGPPAPDHMEDPLTRRALHADRKVERFLDWSIMPIAHITWSGCTARVTFRDARFQRPRFEDSFSASADLPSGRPGCPPR